MKSNFGSASVVTVLCLLVLSTSLFYCGHIIHQYAQVRAMATVTTGMRETLHVLAVDSELLDIYNRGKKDFNALNAAEQSRVRAYVQGFFNVFYQAWYAWTLGLLPDTYWLQTERGLKAILQTSLFRTHWTQRGGAFPEDFQGVVNDLIN